MSKVRSQIKAYFFKQTYPTSIIGFLSTIKLACNTNNIPEGSVMWVFPHYGKETHADEIIICMCAKDPLSSFATFVRIEERMSRKPLRCFPEVENCLERNMATRRLLKMMQQFRVTSNHAIWLLNNTTTIESPNPARSPPDMTKELSMTPSSKMWLSLSSMARATIGQQTRKPAWWIFLLRYAHIFSSKRFLKELRPAISQTPTWQSPTHVNFTST